MFFGYQPTDLGDNKECLLYPDDRTPEKYEADLRNLKKLPKLRKQYAAMKDLFCNREKPLYKKAVRLGFSRAECMYPELAEGREVPHDLQEWGKGIIASVELSVYIRQLEKFDKILKARAKKSSVRSGIWSNAGVVGKKMWATMFS